MFYWGLGLDAEHTEQLLIIYLRGWKLGVGISFLVTFFLHFEVSKPCLINLRSGNFKLEAIFGSLRCTKKGRCIFQCCDHHFEWADL